VSVVVFLVALVARLATVAWAAARIPPTADGTYYHRIAERIAEGHGYTWLWPDGAVTYAAHYPVGLPAMAALAYVIAGPKPWAAMLLGALLGALSALAAHRLAVRAVGTSTSRDRSIALASGLLVALHPALVMYTPALMTEGVTASLIICAAAVAAWARDRQVAERKEEFNAKTQGRRGAKRLGEEFDSSSFCASAPLRLCVLSPALLVGLVLGITTLVRPQSIALAPLFGFLAAPIGATWKRIAKTVAITTIAAFLVCAPWTARNCVRMKRCALVSVNGGWNLLIGADAASTGAWSPVKVPEPCREVWDEAQKDACFGREARRWIAAHPAAWIALVPRKLAATFDYAGAAPWYLHDANEQAFPSSAKLRLGAIETIFERVTLLAALAWAARRASDDEGRTRFVRAAIVGVSAVGAVFVFLLHAWVAYAALAVAGLLRPRALLREPVVASATIFALVATIATHAVFFGAGRYSLPLFPLLAALAPLAWRRPVPSAEPRGSR
jgi:4-amino-4-deoxy-L-arabinose transferase-like glycosyltransferase